MFKDILNRLLENGVWFAAMMIHLMSAFITTTSILLVGVIVDWFGKNT